MAEENECQYAKNIGRISMKSVYTCFLILFYLINSALHAEEFRDITDLTNWRNYQKATVHQNWSFEGAVLSLKKGGGDLLFKEQLENFELKLKWKAPKGVNSGVFIGVSEAYEKHWHSGVEMQILNRKSEPLQSSGACYWIQNLALGKMKSDDWNDVHIIKNGHHIQFYLNGFKTADFKTDNDFFQKISETKFGKHIGFMRHPRGYIVLQDHKGDMQFKDILLKKLPDSKEVAEISLFNGRDFTGWTHGSDEMKEIWSVRDGVFHNKGKPKGWIQTVGKYKNFELNLEFRHLTKGNTGFLIRALNQGNFPWPRSLEVQGAFGNVGDFWNIDQVIMVTDSTKLKGRNTQKLGGTNNKPVGEWNKVRILVEGEMLTVWVNDVLQNKATSLIPHRGHICLQSEGAAAEYRNISIREYPDNGVTELAKEPIWQSSYVELNNMNQPQQFSLNCDNLEEIYFAFSHGKNQKSKAQVNLELKFVMEDGSAKELREQDLIYANSDNGQPALKNGKIISGACAMLKIKLPPSTKEVYGYFEVSEKWKKNTGLHKNGLSVKGLIFDQPPESIYFD